MGMRSYKEKFESLKNACDDLTNYLSQFPRHAGSPRCECWKCRFISVVDGVSKEEAQREEVSVWCEKSMTSETKDQVLLWFSREMRAKMEDRRDKNPDGWRMLPLGFAFRRLGEEVGELGQALIGGEAGISQIISEAADVANFAMFIADIASRKAP